VHHDDARARAVEREPEPLAVAARPEHAPARERARDGGWRRLQRQRVVGRRARVDGEDDAAGDARRELAPRGLDLGQLGHGVQRAVVASARHATCGSTPGSRPTSRRPRNAPRRPRGCAVGYPTVHRATVGKTGAAERPEKRASPRRRNPAPAHAHY
jgi:hypothetical protein